MMPVAYRGERSVRLYACICLYVPVLDQQGSEAYAFVGVIKRLNLKTELTKLSVATSSRGV